MVAAGFARQPAGVRPGPASPRIRVSLSLQSPHMSRFGISFAATVALAVLLSSWPVWALAPAQPSDAQRSTLREIVRSLDKRHYRHLKLDDRFSEELFDLYLKRLDPARTYLVADDVAALEPCRKLLDDELEAAALDCAYRIYNRFQDRLVQRLEANLAYLGSDAQIDFGLAESLPIDTHKRPWLQDAGAGDEYWRRRMKDSLLRLLMSGKEPQAARELLIKRYRTQIHRLNQQTSDDAFDVFANTVAGMYDPHTSFMDARSMENFQISMSLSLEGIGAVLQSEDEHTKVVRVVPGGPADKDGRLHAGDRITGVAQGRKDEMTDVIGWRIDDVVAVARREDGDRRAFDRAAAALASLLGRQRIGVEHRRPGAAVDGVALRQRGAAQQGEGQISVHGLATKKGQKPPHGWRGLLRQLSYGNQTALRSRPDLGLTRYLGRGIGRARSTCGIFGRWARPVGAH